MTDRQQPLARATRSPTYLGATGRRPERGHRFRVVNDLGGLRTWPVFDLSPAMTSMVDRQERLVQRVPRWEVEVPTNIRSRKDFSTKRLSRGLRDWIMAGPGVDRNTFKSRGGRRR